MYPLLRMRPLKHFFRGSSGRNEFDLNLINRNRSPLDLRFGRTELFQSEIVGNTEDPSPEVVTTLSLLQVLKQCQKDLLDHFFSVLNIQSERHEVAQKRNPKLFKELDDLFTDLRWDRFARFIDDGRICLTNNAAERALRGFALGRKSWLFAGSDRGADRAAVMATLIMTARLNDIDPQAWLADVLARINDHAVHRLDELLPWNWRKPMSSRAEAA